MSHDFDPSWDYPLVDLDSVYEVDSKTRESILAVISRLKTDLAPAMGFVACDGQDGFDVFFTECMGLSSVTGGTAVAVYCSGTGSRPVVGFDLYSMQEICQEEGLNLVHQFELSLAHELAHGYQESIGLEEGPDGHESLEDAAEAFGCAWVDSKQIELWRLNPPVSKPRRKPRC